MVNHHNYIVHIRGKHVILSFRMLILMLLVNYDLDPENLKLVKKRLTLLKKEKK